MGLKVLWLFAWWYYHCTIWDFADTKMLEQLPPDSDEQQALITEIQNDDGYNWG